MKSLRRTFVLVLSPFVLVCAFLVVIGGVLEAAEWWGNRQYPPMTHFVKSRWASDQRYRFSVLPTVEKSIVKKGMTRAQVQVLLGKPDTKGNGPWGDGSWEYDTQRPGIYSSDFQGTLLRIEFDSKGNVARARKEDWTD